MQLRNYQKKAIDSLLTQSKKLLAKNGSKICVFKAPTGSGKTIMVADFLQKLADEHLPLDLAFVWISSNDLHSQSKEKLAAHLADSVYTLSFLEEVQEFAFDAFKDYTSAVTTETLIQKFERLADTWQKETALASSIGLIQANPSYLRMIAMGKDALPLIFQRMRHNPDHWFIALNAITGENPVQEADRGDVEAMTESWLRWAKKNAYVAS
jgi:hypothetical protein